jgi:cytidine deaminase
MVHDELITRARDAMEQAYAPYSGFRVGAALLGEDGSIHTGCNVENASYGLTICAERAALAGAVGRGVTRFRRVAIVTNGSEAVAPCGACRQVLAEFSPEMTVVSAAGAERKSWTLGQLLPHPFEPPAEWKAGR